MKNINISLDDIVFKATLKDSGKLTCYRKEQTLAHCDTWLGVNYESYKSVNPEPGIVGKSAIEDKDTNRNLTPDAL